MLIMRPIAILVLPFQNTQWRFELPHAIAYCQSLHPVTNPCQTHTPVVLTSSLNGQNNVPCLPLVTNLLGISAELFSDQILSQLTKTNAELRGGHLLSFSLLHLLLFDHWDNRNQFQSQCFLNRLYCFIALAWREC